MQVVSYRKNDDREGQAEGVAPHRHSPQSAGVPSHDPETLLKKGMDRHRAGDLAEAERLYRRVVASRPREANAHNLLGVRRPAARRGPGSAPAHRARPRARSRGARLPRQPWRRAGRGGRAPGRGGLPSRRAPAPAGGRGRAPQPGPGARRARRPARGARAAGARRGARSRTRRSPTSPWPMPGGRSAMRRARPWRRKRRSPVRRRTPRWRRRRGSLLAALGRAAVPDRAPASYVRDLFDGFAERFDADLAGGLGYRTPELLAAALRDAAGAAEGAGQGPRPRLRHRPLRASPWRRSWGG